LPRKSFRGRVGMMSKERAFIVWQHLDDEVRLGRIALTAGVLTVVEAMDERARNKLQHDVDEFNFRPFLFVKAPPRGDADEHGGRYGLGAVEKKRGEDGFDEMLLGKLKQMWEGQSLDLEEDDPERKK